MLLGTFSVVMFAFLIICNRKVSRKMLSFIKLNSNRFKMSQFCPTCDYVLTQEIT